MIVDPIFGGLPDLAQEATLESTSMDRLCGRPGCSEPASVAYGMRAEDLVFWLDALPDATDGIGGALCRRHADTMIVPRGWTLDDLRDPDLHLFRPPPPAPAAPRGVRRRTRVVAPAEQLALVPDPTGSMRIPEPDLYEALDPTDPTPRPTEPVHADGESDVWTPSFDEADDLGGLLSARSPLLARAFRTAERADG